MNPQESISDFFYNLVPGILFIIGLLYLLNGFPLAFILAKNKEGLVIFLLIIFGLLFGFIFQGLTKICRQKIPLNKWIMDKVKDDNSDIYPKIALKYLPKQDKNNIVRDFYLMHDYLLAKKLGSQTNFYSARFAFWSNIFVANFLLIIINLYVCKSDFITFLLIVQAFSTYLSYEYFRAMYDVILKTFVIVQFKN